MNSDYDQLPAAFLSQIFDQMHEGVLVTDADLDEPGPRVVYANPAFSRMTGYSLDEILGRSPRFLQGPGSDREVLGRLRRNLSEGETFEGETINYRKDGTPFFMQWYIEPLRNDDGGIKYFVAVQRDVTEEKERTRRQRTLEQAISQLPDMALLFSAEGVVSYANRSYFQWSQLPPPAVHGAKIWQLPGAPKRRDLSWARRILGQKTAWRKEYSVSKQEEDRILLTTVSPITNAAGATEYLAVARDFTENRRQELMVEAQHFQTNMGQVVRELAHELSAPINTLKSTLKVVTAQGSAGSAENYQRHLGSALEQTRQLESAVRSLLESWPQDPSLGPPDMSSFLSRLIEAMHSELNS